MASRSPSFIDEAGKRYGRLQVLAMAARGHNRSVRWLCRCDCGVENVVLGSSLRRGVTVSCGCNRREKLAASARTHGWSQTRTYKTWRGMVGRCTDPRNASFAKYAGRGVTVCDRWLTFEKFLEDMGERPAGKTLDRIRNEDGYAPGNCRWATVTEQNNNRRNVRMLSAFGERVSLVEWSRRTGIAVPTIFQRLKHGWEPERALTERVHKHLAAEHATKVEIVS